MSRISFVSVTCSAEHNQCKGVVVLLENESERRTGEAVVLRMSLSRSTKKAGNNQTYHKIPRKGPPFDAQKLMPKFGVVLYVRIYLLVSKLKVKSQKK